MKKKKSIILMLAVLLIVIVGIGVNFFGNKNNQNSEDQKEEIKLTIKVPVLQTSSYKDSNVKSAYDLVKKLADNFEEQYKEANVKVAVIEFEKDKEDDQIIGCFDTNEAADVLYEEYFNMSTYVHTGKVVPLDDIITEDIRNDIDDNYWDVSKLNGKTYMMPYLGMQNTICYNKDLFKEAGLEKYVTDEDVIQNWSLEDWDIILSTLQKKLPENIYPMLMYAKNEMGDTHIITLLRSRGSTFFDENGRVKLTTPEGIAAVKWLMECNEKGYFPANATNIEINDCYDLFMNGQLAIYINNAVLNDTLKTSGINYGNANFPSVDGKGFNTTFLTGFEVFDNGNEEKLKVAKDFIKYIYETDDLLDYSAGAIPCSNAVATRFAKELEEEQKYIDNSKQGWNFTGNTPEWRKVRAVFYKDIKQLLDGEKTPEEIAKLIEDDCNKAIEEGYASSKLHE